MKALDSIVLAMVIPGYKGVVDSTQTMKTPLEKTINEKKEDVVNVQKKITEQLSGKTILVSSLGISVLFSRNLQTWKPIEFTRLWLPQSCCEKKCLLYSQCV